MTGFGKGAEKSPYGDITVEIKTLNHKSLSITCNPLNGFFLLEEKVNKVCAKKLFRGKVFVKIAQESGDSRKFAQQVQVNEHVAREYLKKITKVQKNLGLEGTLLIRDLMGYPGVIESKAAKKEEKLWPQVKKALEKALEKLVEYRQSEGARLARDFNARLGKIKKNLKEIKKYEKEGVKNYRKKLMQVVREGSEGIESDRSRVEAEVALFARSCDIAEEITRLNGHLASYENAINETKTDAGKKLDFIAQEMQRETNTIGAKSGDLRIANAVIEIKSEIEKIREQTKNVE